MLVNHYYCFIFWLYRKQHMGKTGFCQCGYCLDGREQTRHVAQLWGEHRDSMYAGKKGTCINLLGRIKRKHHICHTQNHLCRYTRDKLRRHGVIDLTRRRLLPMFNEIHSKANPVSGNLLFFHIYSKTCIIR